MIKVECIVEDESYVGPLLSKKKLIVNSKNVSFSQKIGLVIYDANGYVTGEIEVNGNDLIVAAQNAMRTK